LSRVARPNSPGFLIDQKTGCKVWDEIPAEGERVTWFGLCLDGLAEGQGTVIFSSNEGRQTITGIFAKGREADGPRKIVELDGSVEAGMIKDGRWEGRFVENYPNGSPKFDGEVRAGKKDGFGVHYWAPPSKSRYEGFFKYGMANGNGTIFTESDGKMINYNVTAKNGCLWIQRAYVDLATGNFAGAIDNTEGACRAGR
jgi:hypothetical protein